jgi:hypothetical protein
MPKKEKNEMEYQLEIYGPGTYESDGCIKVFNSTAPFLPLRGGDLLNASIWGKNGSGFQLLRVLTVEHLISEKSSAGIDPSGRIIHRARIYTEGVADTPGTRHELYQPTSPKSKMSLTTSASGHRKIFLEDVCDPLGT